MPLMRLCDNIYLIGSGGFGISNPGDCHIYLIDGGDSLAIVDAGCGKNVGTILDNIRETGLSLGSIRMILLTHSHMDHAAGCVQLRDALIKNGSEGVKVITSSAEAEILAHGSAEDLGLDVLGRIEQPRNQVFPPFTVDTCLEDAVDFQMGNLTIRPLIVRGHNPGCVCYFLETTDKKRCLFAGDVLCVGGVISLGNWIGTDLQSYRTDLKKLSGLQVDALLPGHHMLTMRNGQESIDKANHAFAGLFPPPNISQIP